MTEIEFVDVNEWIEERYKKENNGLNFEEMVSGKDMRKKLWEIKVRETRGTYGENLKRRVKYRYTILWIWRIISLSNQICRVLLNKQMTRKTLKKDWRK